MTTAQKNDYVDLKYTGYVNGEVFDSNIEADLKKLDSKAKPRKTIIIIGQGMVVPGLDSALEGKEVGKDYEVEVPFKDGFGDRKRDLVKTIPLKIFTEKRINPQAGMVLNMDNMLAKIITVSGARVVTDFNNPLSGKDLIYKFKIERKVMEEKEKVETVLELLFKFVPEFEIKDKVVMKGPKAIGQYVDIVKEKFKELVGKELGFEEKEMENVEPEEKEIKKEKSIEESKKEDGKARAETGKELQKVHGEKRDNKTSSD